MSAWIADALVLLGLSVLTVALLGLVRLESVLMALHASSKAAALGVVPLALAAAVADPDMSAPAAVLVIAFIVVTAPASSHLIARAAHLGGEDEQAQADGRPGPADEAAR